MAGLRLERLRKHFGEIRAVDDVSLQVEANEIVAILGPSGCGKSTLLFLTAGLESADGGDVLWDGGSVRAVPPHKRGFGMMFQEFALFPHMDVAGNVAFGLRMQHLSEPEIDRRVGEVLTLVGLPDFGRRQVDQLSGGERQRIALARSLAPRPRLLMLDEPLGSLDRTLKERLMLELPAILRSSGGTVLYVTHDQEEAFAVADRVAIMKQGGFVQIGTPEAIYRQPASPFVARFLGLDNLLKGSGERSAGGWQVRTELGSFPVEPEVEGPVSVLLRPETASLDGEGSMQLEGELVERSFRGSTQRIVLRLDSGQRLSFDFGASARMPELGDKLRLSLDPRDAIQVLP